MMLASKVALVTGAAQGIGLATTRLLLRHGAKVSMVDLDHVGNKVCTDLQKEFPPNDVQFLEVDVTDGDQLKTAFMKTKETLGALDIVCNIAGVIYTEDWKKTLDINLVALVNGTFLGIEHMSTQKGGNGGSIINMSSLAGVVAAPNNPIYATSKHGVVGFSRSMISHATTDSVRVNCICPSFVRTKMIDTALIAKIPALDEMIKKHGIAEPEDVAEVVLELITDTSKVGDVVSLTAHGKKYLKFLDAQDFKS